MRKEFRDHSSCLSNCVYLSGRLFVVIHSEIYSSVPGTALGAGDTKTLKSDTAPAQWSL